MAVWGNKKSTVQEGLVQNTDLFYIVGIGRKMLSCSIFGQNYSLNFTATQEEIG